MSVFLKGYKHLCSWGSAYTGARNQDNVWKPSELVKLFSSRDRQPSESQAWSLLLHTACVDFSDLFQSRCSFSLTPAVRLHVCPALLCAVLLLRIYLGRVQKSASHGASTRRGGGGDPKLWLHASAVIFFITEPVLTYIMECTGRDSERQRLQSGPLPTLGYANPSTAVWVWESNDQTKHFPSFLSLIYGFLLSFPLSIHPPFLSFF